MYTSHYRKEVPFEVPESWEWTTISMVSLSIQYGISESAKSSGNYKFLRITDIQDNEVNWESVPYVSIDNNKAIDYLLENNDILFARTGATVGKSYIISTLNDKVIFASYLIRIKPSTHLNASYIKLFFESEFYWNQIVEKSVGIGQPNVNGTSLSELKIPIPPLLEQQRIVSMIRPIFTVIKKIEKNEHDLLQYINQAKSKILDLAIRGKLVPQDPNDEPASALLERIKAEHPERKKKPSKTSDNSHYENLPFQIPESWAWCTFDDVFEIIMGQSPSGADINQNEGIEFHQGKLYFGESVLQHSQTFTRKISKIAPANSLIMCVRAPVGNVNITDREVCVGRGLCSLKPLGGISTNFMFFWIDYFKETFNRKATGSTFVAISGEIIRSQQIPIPPTAEQKRILNRIHQFYSILDKVREKLL